jgi:hypothetical protein
VAISRAVVNHLPRSLGAGKWPSSRFSVIGITILVLTANPRNEEQMGNVEAELLRAILGLPDTKKKQKEGAASRSRVLGPNLRLRTLETSRSQNPQLLG